MALKCPKCGAVNPDNARFCWNDGEKFTTTGPFQFRNGTTANSIDDLVNLIDNNWSESQQHLYSGNFATWFSGIGRGDLALEAKEIVQKDSDQEIGLRKLIRRMEKQPAFRFSDGTQAHTIPELVAAIDTNWDEGKRYLYQHDDLADWLETIQRDDLAKTARQIISTESDQNIGLEKFLQGLGTDAPSKPQLTVSPSTIDFGTVDADKVSKAGYTKQVIISNAGRGHLHGTITSSESLITIDKTYFSGNVTTIEATAQVVRRRATITIESNGGTETLPVRMNPIYPIWRIVISVDCIIGLLAGLAAYFFSSLPIFYCLISGLLLGSAISSNRWVYKVQRNKLYIISFLLFVLGVSIITIHYYQYSRNVTTVISVFKSRFKKVDVRERAANALGSMGDVRAVQPLINALKDNDRRVRSSAAYALGNIGDIRAEQPLIDALKDNDKWLRESAASALGRIGDAKAVEPLIDTLKDNDEWVRWRAASALGEIGDARAVEPLKQALKDKDESVRKAAKEALEKIQKR